MSRMFSPERYAKDVFDLSALQLAWCLTEVWQKVMWDIFNLKQDAHRDQVLEQGNQSSRGSLFLCGILCCIFCTPPLCTHLLIAFVGECIFIHSTCSANGFKNTSNHDPGCVGCQKHIGVIHFSNKWAVCPQLRGTQKVFLAQVPYNQPSV